MAPWKRSVLLLKAPKDQATKDPYVQTLQDAGLSAACVGVLGFTFVNDDTLTRLLRDPDAFSGLILTSPRAVEAVNRCLADTAARADWNAVSGAKWREKPVFVVGHATASPVSDLGLCPLGKETGSAELLAPFIIDYLKDSGDVSKPLLFPCSSMKRETTPRTLAGAGIPVKCLTVYDTGPDANIEKNLRGILDTKGDPEHVVFFSPSGVTFAEPHLRALNLPLEDLKCVAIGRTTEEALRERGLPVFAVASHPTPQSLTEAILGTGAR